MSVAATQLDLPNAARDVQRAEWHWKAQPGALPSSWAQCSKIGQKGVFAPLRTVCNGENGPNDCLITRQGVA